MYVLNELFKKTRMCLPPKLFPKIPAIQRVERFIKISKELVPVILSEAGQGFSLT